MYTTLHFKFQNYKKSSQCNYKNRLIHYFYKNRYLMKMKTFAVKAGHWTADTKEFII